MKYYSINGKLKPHHTSTNGSKEQLNTLLNIKPNIERKVILRITIYIK